jgi:hypothetical protein
MSANPCPMNGHASVAIWTAAWSAVAVVAAEWFRRQSAQRQPSACSAEQALPPPATPPAVPPTPTPALVQVQEIPLGTFWPLMATRLWKLLASFWPALRGPLWHHKHGASTHCMAVHCFSGKLSQRCSHSLPLSKICSLLLSCFLLGMMFTSVACLACHLQGTTSTAGSLEEWTTWRAIQLVICCLSRVSVTASTRWTHALAVVAPAVHVAPVKGCRLGLSPCPCAC